ncbi:Acyl carrier protein [Syntrophobotulus glycolicus DSM 8271]|uniref:Acyl carrier protein n=1 Tax=Syntrophobotulus glycolicus (strain DSM 8271 / FlGlyR) TaxID=645991 RepID=F0T0D3_SYNGF|nr:acyl carrier protein [Syntrophobotulus glycolicus]ADY57305.1 Acyl carrier protein [Syntrophobotulus glycolicus DSM 8271]
MIFEIVRQVTAHKMNIEEQKITLKSAFKNDLKVDSLDIFEIILELEERFSVEIPTEDLEDIQTVRDLVEYLEKRKEKESH